MTTAHEEKETLTVEVNIPEHADRVTTSLFSKTRKQLIERDKVCWISGKGNDKQSPLEAHHYPIERSLAEMVDWDYVRRDAEAGELGISQAQRDAAKLFDWTSFFVNSTIVNVAEYTDENGIKYSASSYRKVVDPYLFVDNMLVNGLLLAKNFHIGKDEGIHMMPHPLWIAQRYGIEGYKYSDVEIIHHQE